MRIVRVRKPRMRRINEIPIFFTCPECSNPFHPDSAYIEDKGAYLIGVDGQGRRVCQNCLHKYLTKGIRKEKEVKQ